MEAYLRRYQILSAQLGLEQNLGENKQTDGGDPIFLWQQCGKPNSNDNGKYKREIKRGRE